MKVMSIEDKIRRRIKTMEQIKQSHIDEIQITKEEAAKLGDKTSLDGVKLIIVDKLGEKTKRDCFAFQR